MNQSRLDIPIQPVERIVLFRRYEAPFPLGLLHRQTGQRDAGFWYKTKRMGIAQPQALENKKRMACPWRLRYTSMSRHGWNRITETHPR